MTPAELKAAGQSRSLFDLDPTTWDKFLSILTSVPVGHEVHVNGLREELDAATDPDIPAKMRGALFNRAARMGLITPLLTADGDESRRKSDGLSAHHATCRLYVRTVAA